MATFVQKEILLDEMYSSVMALITRKTDAQEGYTSEMINDIRLIAQFKGELVDKMPEEIDFDEAMNFYRDMENKYKSMPNKW